VVQKTVFGGLVVVYLRSHDIANRPNDLADRMKRSRDPLETFTIPLADAFPGMDCRDPDGSLIEISAQGLLDIASGRRNIRY
jgi:hypothetical protein